MIKRMKNVTNKRKKITLMKKKTLQNIPNMGTKSRIEDTILMIDNEIKLGELRLM